MHCVQVDNKRTGDELNWERVCEEKKKLVQKTSSRCFCRVCCPFYVPFPQHSLVLVLTDLAAKHESYKVEETVKHSIIASEQTTEKKIRKEKLHSIVAVKKNLLGSSHFKI